MMLYCLKKVHVGMIVGKDGKNIEKMKNFVEKELAISIGKKVDL